MVWKWGGPVFGNNGISWLPGLVVVNGKLPEPELTRVINNEMVHQRQWLECFVVGFPFVYIGLYIFTLLKGDEGYYDHPMEIDSRRWDEDLDNRPAYWWFNVV